MTPRLAPPTRRPALRRQALRRASRRAFTLVEILVVITIIAVLASLVAVASVGFIGSAREAATRTTIKKVDEAILERVSSVNRWHQRAINRLEPDWRYRGWETRWYLKGLQVFSDTPTANEAKLVLSRKGMLMEMLPVNVEELKNAYWFWARFQDSSTATPDFSLIDGVRVPYLNASEEAAMNAWLADMDGDSSNGSQSLDTPGEVFYYALLNAPVYGGRRVSEDDFKPSELVDVPWTFPDGTLSAPDGQPDVSPIDGVYELGDAWGNALRFYRWPTRLVNDRDPPSSYAWASSNPALKILMPNAPTNDLKYDPDDRAGYLTVVNPLTKLPIVETFHDFNTWHSPLVVSAGPDGKTGLLEPSDVSLTATPPVRGDLAEVPGVADRTVAPRTTALEQMYDNITNHTGRAGGPTQ